MTSTALNTTEGKQVARPLSVLVPLIKEDLKQAESAGMPYYRAAGEKMLEAKGQMRHGEFGPWITRHFSITVRHAQNYMGLVKTETKANAGVRFSSLDDYRRRGLGHSGVIPGSQRDKAWREPVSNILAKAKANAQRLAQEELNRAEERDAQRKLALQLIDIGYRALAVTLHPDKVGGSREAMARLITVRDRLKASV